MTCATHPCHAHACAVLRSRVWLASPAQLPLGCLHSCRSSQQHMWFVEPRQPTIAGTAARPPKHRVKRGEPRDAAAAKCQDGAARVIAAGVTPGLQGPDPGGGRGGGGGGGSAAAGKAPRACWRAGSCLQVLGAWPQGAWKAARQAKKPRRGAPAVSHTTQCQHTPERNQRPTQGSAAPLAPRQTHADALRPVHCEQAEGGRGQACTKMTHNWGPQGGCQVGVRGSSSPHQQSVGAPAASARAGSTPGGKHTQQRTHDARVPPYNMAITS